MRLVPRLLEPGVAAAYGTTARSLPMADWHLLFDAVTSRLRAVADNPAQAAVVVPECVEALGWLQRALDPPERRRGR